MKDIPDPEAQKILDEKASKNLPPLSDWTPAFARGLSGNSAAEIPKGTRSLHIPTSMGNISANLHSPDGDGPFPLILFFHGGGFVVGMQDYPTTLQKLAAFIPAIIVAPEYRLAPEHKYPAALEDAIAVFEHIISGLDVGKSYLPDIFIMGDSAGGNLAANVVRHATEKQIFRTRGQILIYPWLDLTLTGDSIQEFAAGFGLTQEKLVWYRNHYLPENVLTFNDPKISPLFESNFTNQPPTFIGTAACDVVRDDGERFANKLGQAGNSVSLKRYDGMIHGFFEYGDRLKPANDLFSDIQKFVLG